MLVTYIIYQKPKPIGISNLKFQKKMARQEQ